MKGKQEMRKYFAKFGEDKRVMRLLVGVAGLLAAIALLGLGGGRALLAAIEGSANIPERMSYQGTLANSSGPYTGDSGDCLQSVRC
jgi:hypothetical protein